MECYDRQNQSHMQFHHRGFRCHLAISAVLALRVTFGDKWHGSFGAIWHARVRHEEAAARLSVR